MPFRTHSGLLVSFECESCQNPCDATKDRRGGWGRAFCSKCGAAYSLFLIPGNASRIERISFGEKYMTRHRPSRWRRLGALIRNR